MKKTWTLIATVLFTLTAISQKPNPVIGKKEFEISLSVIENSTDYLASYQNLAGAQIMHRWSWKKYTKVGIGGLVAVQDYDPLYESDFVPYGALFCDITQFIGKRQKGSFSGQVGHGIFKRERKIEEATYKGVDKNTAGMYYSISFNYRSIISKKILMTASVVYTFRNFRQKVTTEYYSPPSVEEYTLIEKYSGPGLRL